MTEHGLLGAGWAEWQIQPSGGDEILACWCVSFRCLFQTLVRDYSTCSRRGADAMSVFFFSFLASLTASDTPRTPS